MGVIGAGPEQSEGGRLEGKREQRLSGGNVLGLQGTARGLERKERGTVEGGEDREKWSDGAGLMSHRGDLGLYVLVGFSRESCTLPPSSPESLKGFIPKTS